MLNITNKNIAFAHAALFAASVIYGANYSIAKSVMDPGYIKPLGFIMLRVLSAALLFNIVFFVFIKEKVEKQDYLRLFMCSIFGVVFNQIMFFVGLKLTSPINSAIIMTSTPLLVLVLSAFLLNEKITIRKVIGIFLGLGAVWSLILYKGDISVNPNQMVGDLCTLLNALSYGIYLIIVKPLLKKYHPITISTIMFTIAIPLVSIVGFQEVSSIKWQEFSTVIWLDVIYVLVFTTFLAYLCNALALRTLSPSIVSIYIYVQPLLATFFAIALGSDVVTLQKLIACIFIFIGIYLVSTSKKEIIS